MNMNVQIVINKLWTGLTLTIQIEQIHIIIIRDVVHAILNMIGGIKSKL